jgi:hypothetical protein
VPFLTNENSRFPGVQRRVCQYESVSISATPAAYTGFCAVSRNCSHSVSRSTQIIGSTKRFIIHDFNLWLKHSLKRSYGGESKITGTKNTYRPSTRNSMCELMSRRFQAVAPAFCSIYTQKYSKAKGKVDHVINYTMP